MASCLNKLQHVCTLYLGPIWRLWMGIEGMDGLSLLFTAITSHKSTKTSDFLTSALLKDKQTCPQYYWMPLNYLQHVCALYIFGSLPRRRKGYTRLDRGHPQTCRSPQDLFLHRQDMLQPSKHSWATTREPSMTRFTLVKPFSYL